MNTTITYISDNTVAAEVPDLNMFFAAPRSDFNKKHNGVWDSRVMAFVPKLPDTFSDGQPIEHSYQDHSSVYFEHCVVCGVDTKGNRYCGASCEQRYSERET